MVMKKYLKRCKKQLIIYLLSNFIGAGTAVSLAFVLGQIADVAINLEVERFFPVAVFTACYILVDTFFDYMSTFSNSLLLHNISLQLRKEVVDKIERLPYSVKVEKSNSEYLSLVNNDLNTIGQEYIGAFCAMLYQVFCLIFAVISTFAIQPVITLVMLCVSVLPVLFPKVTEKALQQRKQEALDSNASYLKILGEIFEGFTTLKLFEGFRGINRLHDAENQKFKKARIRFAHMNRVVYSGAYGLSNLIYLGTWVVGLAFVVQNRLTVAELIVLAQLMQFVGGPIQIISERYSLFVSAKGVFRNIQKFLTEEPDEKSVWGDKELSQVESVELRTVSCRLQDTDILNDICMQINRGEKIAILGESGSGKSTLLKVLAGLIPCDGEYLLNGSSYRSFKLEHFRNKVIMMNQDTAIFDTDIRDNVSVFCDIPDERILRAIQAAGLEKWFEGKEKDLSSVIGKEMNALSGGEKRRLEFARIMVREADVVLLDEPTAGLDAENRSIIENLITSYDAGMMLVSTHNYNAEYLKQFDKIVVMEKGHIAFCGSYGEAVQYGVCEELRE